MPFSRSNTLFSPSAPLLLAALALLALPSLRAQDPKLPDGPGKVTTEKLCGSCHGAEIVMSRRETREGWNGITADMVERGAQGTDDEFGEVVDYLTAHFPKSAPLPKINVNRAAAKDLVAGLGIPDAQAAKIIQYRTANGTFKSVDDLVKVPGIDTAKLQAKKNRLDF